MFITLEGIDGSGKSTQAGLLCDWLENEKGYPVLRTFEPGGWAGGEALRRLLLNRETPITSRTELLLFLADRGGHLDANVIPALERKCWVVCERYTDSTLAYQSGGRGIPLREIEEILNWCKFREPDLTILLDIDLETSFSRLGQRENLDRIEAESGAKPDENGFMARVARSYRELAQRHSDRIVVVDARMSVERVAESVRGSVERRRKERGA
jgi:dTMP kinase